MRSDLLLCLALTQLACTPGNVASQTAGTTAERVSAVLAERRSALIEIRRDLHRHPEVSGQEERTAGIVTRYLRDLGLDVRTGVGGHGVVGLLRGERPGPVIAFRADMDAVPSTTHDPVGFRSTTPGVRHICGHDLHTTIGLALAEALAAVRDSLTGSVMFVFQPAEENATGARAMLADGVFADVTPDAIFAYHIAPYDLGFVETAVGPLMPGRDRLRIVATGTGDLRTVLSVVRQAVEGVSTVTPQTPTAAPDFIRVRVTSDGVANPTLATLTATITTARSDVRDLVQAALDTLAFRGVRVTLEYETRAIAGVTNDPAVTERAITTAAGILGRDHVLVSDRITTVFSEDFGSLQEHVPGTMFFLGAANAERGWVSMPHAPTFIADEAVIELGARVMAEVILSESGSRAGEWEQVRTATPPDHPTRNPPPVTAP